MSDSELDRRAVPSRYWSSFHRRSGGISITLIFLLYAFHIRQI